MADSKKKKVGAGWVRTSRDGKTNYISIVISGGLNPDINLVVFKNGYKEKDEQPDFIVYLSAPRDGNGAAAEKPKPAAAPFPGEEQGDPITDAPDDDLPY